MFSVLKMDAALLSRTAWMSAIAYFAVNNIGPLMEKDLTFSITVIKWIWLRAQHPSSEVLGTLEAPGELRLQQGPAVEEAASAGRELRNQGEESASPCPELPSPRDASGPHRCRSPGWLWEPTA